MTTTTMDVATVAAWHRIFRWGHDSTWSHLVSPQTSERIDYAQGVVSIGFVITITLLIWMVLLLIVKLILQPSMESLNQKDANTQQQQRKICDSLLSCIPCLSNNLQRQQQQQRIPVPWIAGGSRIDVQYIKRYHRHLKPNLQRMVLRSWRIQSWFLLSAFIIPFLTYTTVEKGILPTQDGWNDLRYVSGTISDVIYQARGHVDTILSEVQSWANMDDPSRFPLNQPNFCPNLKSQNIPMSLWNHSLPSTFLSMSAHHGPAKDLYTAIDLRLSPIQQGLLTAGEATQDLEDILETLLENDWIPKFTLLILNILTGFLVVGVLLSRNNIIFHPYQFSVTFFFMPTFILVLILLIFQTSLIAVISTFHGDLCAGTGGNVTAQPNIKGTIEEVIAMYSTSKSDIIYQTFDFYQSSCTKENPLLFIKAYKPQVQSIIREGKSALQSISQIGVKKMSKDCGADIEPVVSEIQKLVDSFEIVQASFDATLKLSDCINISPIVDDILEGPTCSTTIKGLTWIFGSTLTICILGLCMITLRAALYNATIRKKNRTKEEEIRREFKEYQEYMSQFYEDAYEWKLHPSPRKDIGILGIAPSFETGLTSISLHDSDDSMDESMYFDEVEDIKEDSSKQSYQTPIKKEAASYVEQVMLSDDVIDDEWEPLSPPLDCHAPHKPRKHLARTIQ